MNKSCVSCHCFAPMSDGKLIEGCGCGCHRAANPIKQSDGRHVFRPNGYVTLNELIQFLQAAKDSDVAPDGDSPVYINSPECEEMILIKALAFDWEAVELRIDLEGA